MKPWSWWVGASRWHQTCSGTDFLTLCGMTIDDILEADRVMVADVPITVRCKRCNEVAVRLTPPTRRQEER